MHLLYLSPTGTLGGAERVLLNVMTAVRHTRPDWRPRLLALADGPLLERAERAGVPTTLLPMPTELNALGDSQLAGTTAPRQWGNLLWQSLQAARATWDYGQRLKEAIRALRPALIHSNGIKSHLLLRLTGLRRPPVVWHVHDFYQARPVVRRLLRWARRGVAGALAISRAVAGDLAEALPDLPVRVVANTVDANTFTPTVASGDWLDLAANLPPAPPATVRVGLIATYARWKGQDLFLEAVARLGPCPVPTRFYIIGGPIYGTHGSQFTRNELRDRARTLGVVDQVGFIGFQEEPASAFQALDIVVHASTRPEPFGLTIVEGMACGRAVVVAAAGGAVELFRPDHDALGFRPGDADALADAIRTLLLDPQRRQRLGERARETVLRSFTTAQLGPHIVQAYESFRGAGVRPRVAMASVR
jgi:glycosyltransferase involved in cell wall biosynthesis